MTDGAGEQPDLKAGVRIDHEPAVLDGCPAVELPDPCALVIFGASGDLTGRKLIPALSYL